MILDALSEDVLKFLIDFDKHYPETNINSDDIHSQFPNLSKRDVLGIIGVLAENGFVQVISHDDICDVSLLFWGKLYFENKNIELSKQQSQNVTITNSSNFNVGNNNTISVTTGITADEAYRLIEQSSLSDKEALQEVISLLNDTLENNKPIQPSKFQKAIECVTSVAPLLKLIGGVVFSKMTGQA